VYSVPFPLIPKKQKRTRKYGIRLWTERASRPFSSLVPGAVVRRRCRSKRYSRRSSARPVPPTTTTQRVGVAPSSHVGRHCCVFPSARLAFSVGRPVASVLHACFVSVEFDSRLCCWGPMPKGSCAPHGPPRLCLPRGPRRPSVDLPGYVSRVESRRRDADVCLLCEPVSVWVWP